MSECVDRNNKNRREEGILEAKQNGRYTGRKPIEVDNEILKQVAITFFNKHISEKQAMDRLGINSRSTFYRKIRTFR